MKTEDEIRKAIGDAYQKANDFYEIGDFLQYDQWSEFAGALEWVLED